MYRIICRYQEHVGEKEEANSAAAAAASKNSNMIKLGTLGNAAAGNHEDGTTPLTAHGGTPTAMGGKPQPIFITSNNFLAVYFDRRHKDLKLLLNLLAETSGLPESFRILTLFDKKFQGLWKPQNLRFEEYETVLPNKTVKSRAIVARWNDAPIGHFLANYDARLTFEYTIDITPAPANELGLKSVLYKKDDPHCSRSCSTGDLNIEVVHSGGQTSHHHHTCGKSPGENEAIPDPKSEAKNFRYV